jgi:hypothetical protein
MPLNNSLAIDEHCPVLNKLSHSLQRKAQVPSRLSLCRGYIYIVGMYRSQHPSFFFFSPQWSHVTHTVTVTVTVTCHPHHQPLPATHRRPSMNDECPRSCVTLSGIITGHRCTCSDHHRLCSAVPCTAVLADVASQHNQMSVVSQHLFALKGP